MNKIKLTQGKSVLVDDEDFEYLNQWKWYYSRGYAVRELWTSKENRHSLWMHRLINKTPDGFDTDHINQNTLDNRKSNLRTATRTQNLINSKMRINNKSGIKGVYWENYTNK